MKTKTLVALALALAVMLTACSSLGLNTQTQQIEASCAVAATSLKALTVANEHGKLTAEQKDQVLKATGTITPICTAPNPPTMDAVKAAAFAQAIALLQTRAAALGAKP